MASRPNPNYNPRPILKRSDSGNGSFTSSTSDSAYDSSATSPPSSPSHNRTVHFPRPGPVTETSFTHSPCTYDRSPIVVEKNECAIPKRGARTYYQGEDRGEGRGGGGGGCGYRDRAGREGRERDGRGREGGHGERDERRGRRPERDGKGGRDSGATERKARRERMKYEGEGFESVAGELTE